MKVCRSYEAVHPLLVSIHKRIQKDVIDAYSMPFRLFETSRDNARHQDLLNKGRTKDLLSGHLFNIENDPPHYAVALDYVYYDKKWSWNIRNATVRQWYKLFGHLVLDACPELTWGGMDRNSTNYNHFQLRQSVVIDNLDEYPCSTF